MSASKCLARRTNVCVRLRFGGVLRLWVFTIYFELQMFCYSHAFSVIPLNKGIHLLCDHSWIPACAGMTKRDGRKDEKSFELYRLYNFKLYNSFIVSNYSRRLHSHKTLVLELAADGYNLTQYSFMKSRN